jgi:predicted nucleic acid-binding protein
LIAVDTNVLVYAHRRDAERHDRAADRLRSLAEGRAPWAIPCPCVHEFLAIVTHPRVYDPPSPAAVALDQVEAGRVGGSKVDDARIAALCLVHGVRALWTVDRDFSRLPALQTVNPFSGEAD